MDNRVNLVQEGGHPIGEIHDVIAATCMQKSNLRRILSEAFEQAFYHSTDCILRRLVLAVVSFITYGMGIGRGGYSINKLIPMVLAIDRISRHMSIHLSAQNKNDLLRVSEEIHGNNAAVQYYIQNYKDPENAISADAFNSAHERFVGHEGIGDETAVRAMLDSGDISMILEDELEVEIVAVIPNPRDQRALRRSNRGSH